MRKKETIESNVVEHVHVGDEAKQGSPLAPVREHRPEVRGADHREHEDLET